MKLLLYCVKAKPYLYHDYDYCFDTMNTIDLGYKTFEYTNQRVYDDETGKFLGWETYGNMFKNDSLNGKIVAECDFEVEEIRLIETPEYAGSECNTFIYDLTLNYETETLTEDELCNQSCLNAGELNKYLDLYKKKEICGYAIHIKNLHIFDEPRDIRNYYNIATRTMADCMNQKALLKAPQNMCNAYDVYKNHYIVISIKPEWLCKILNGEKTIEVRKKVLKEMLNNE